MRSRIALSLMFITFAMGACAKDRASVPPAEVDAHVQTPHTAWGNPLEDGPIHVLFIAPRHTLRDAAELSQRLEMNFDTVPIWGHEHADMPSETAQGVELSVAEQLRGALAIPHDLIVVAHVNWNAFSVETQSELFRQVAGGTGLLLANDEPAEGIVYETFLEALTPVEDITAIVHGLGKDMTPEWYGTENLVQASEYGQGRVVQLSYREDRPLTHCLIPALANPIHAVPEFLDSYFSLVARAALWATRRDPSCRVDSVEYLAPSGPPEEEIPPDLPPEFVQTMRDAVQQTPIRTFRVQLTEPAPRDLQVIAQLREPNRGPRVVYRELPVLKKGETAYSFEILAGPGRYLLDLWLRARHGVIAWHTESIQIEGWPSFAGLTLRKTTLLPHDSLDVTADVRTWYGETLGASLYLRGVDSLGRVVGEAYELVPDGGGKVLARINFADLIAHDIRLEAYAVSGPPHPLDDWELNMAACEVRLLPVRHVRQRREPTLIVEAPAAYEYNARHYLDLLHGQGVDGVWTESGEDALPHLARLDLRVLVPSDGDCSAGEDSPGTYCVGDKDWQRERGQQIQEQAARMSAEGILEYSIEQCLLPPRAGALCVQEACWPSFLEWLQKEYASIDAINGRWGSSFPSVSAIQAVTPESILEMGEPGPWLDQCRFLGQSWSAYLGAMRSQAQRVDRYARTGVRVNAAMCDGGVPDWPGLAAGVDWLAVESSPLLLTRMAGYMKQGAGLYWWLGSGSLEQSERARWAAWTAAANAFQGIWIGPPYGPAAGPAESPLLYADGRVREGFASFLEAWQVVESGIGSVFREADPIPNVVAVYDAIADSNWDVLNQSCQAQQAQERMAEVFYRLGYGLDFVSPERLLAQQLAEYKIVLLPSVTMLTESEIGVLRGFVGRGGHVLADLLPGQSKPTSSAGAAAVASLFGARNTGGPVASGDMNLRVTFGGAEGPEEAVLEQVRPAHALEVTDAEALGSFDAIPAWIIRRQEGAVLLLNHLVPPAGQTGDFEGMARLLRAWLGELGVMPSVDFECEGDGLFDGRFYRRRLGEAELLAMVRHPDAGPEEQSIRLAEPKGQHWYDLLSVEGGTPEQRLKFRIGRGDARFLARLPYQVSDLKVVVPESVRQGARLPVSITVKAKGGPCGMHLVAARLAMARGARIEYYDRVVPCEKGAGQFFIPLALNETPGHYILECRDLLSGVCSQQYVQVIDRVR